jgi:hypothetical protein
MRLNLWKRSNKEEHPLRRPEFIAQQSAHRRGLLGRFKIAQSRGADGLQHP